MKIKALFGCVLLLSCCDLLSSQQAKESIVIGPGDLIHIQVLDTPELDQHARVSDSGSVHLIAGPEVKVSGQSPNEAANAIETALVQHGLMKHPTVVVSEEELATAKISIIGEVKVPGAYAIETPRPILQVLSMAGGLSITADRKILIERHGTKETVPYFYSNSGDQAFGSSIKVDPGDTIYVPRAGVAYALGDVKEPGGYTMTNNDGKLSVLELIARAGGTNRSASEGHARLIRKTAQGYVEVPLPLKDMLRGKRADMVLQADDIIYVPFSYIRNAATNSTSILTTAGTAAIYRF
jgi:polysaccharide biosynthesis/export protein